MYVAIGLASWPVGHVTEASARVPSAIAATLTVLFAFSTLRRFVGDGRAFAAAMLLPASVLWLDKVPSAEIDILQLAWVTAALLAFLRAIEAGGLNRAATAVGANFLPSLPLRGRGAGGEGVAARRDKNEPSDCSSPNPLTPTLSPEAGEREPDYGCAAVKTPATRSLWWMAALLCVTGGFLTKWTAPAFFYLAVGPFLLWRGQVRLLASRDHLLAVAIAVGLCATWASLVSADVGWHSLADTVRQEAAQRFAPKANGKPYPWAESMAFPAIVLGASLPWGLLALSAMRPRFLRQMDDRERMVVQLLHCWAWPNLIFWSLPAQHHVRYVLPIAPAFTLLGILAVSKWTATRPRLATIGLISAVLVWAVVKIVFVEAIVPERTAGRNARETGEQLARLVPEGEILYLCRLKDEGVLFYYARPVKRLTVLESPCRSATYVLMLDAEWTTESSRRRADHIAELRDQQQSPIHLVRLHAAEHDRWQPRTPPLSSASAP